MATDFWQLYMLNPKGRLPLKRWASKFQNNVQSERERERSVPLGYLLSIITGSPIWEGNRVKFEAGHG